MGGRSADQRQRARLVEVAQRVLHPPSDEFVALVGHDAQRGQRARDVGGVAQLEGVGAA